MYAMQMCMDVEHTLCEMWPLRLGRILDQSLPPMCIFLFVHLILVENVYHLVTVTHIQVFFLTSRV